MKTAKLKQETYAAELFVPNGGDSNRSCLFAPGFPFSPVVNDAIEWMVEHGYAVLFPQPPGSYDSDGSYSPTSHSTLLSMAANDMEKGRLTHAKTGASVPSLPRPEGIIAHSFGTVAAADCVAAGGFRWALLFAPILGYCRSDPDFGVRESLASQIDYVARSRPFTFRLASSEEIITQSYKGQGSGVLAGGESVSVIGVVGDRDGAFDIERLSSDWTKLVQQRIGSASTSRLHIIPGAGHGITELLAPEVTETLILEV